MSRRFLDTNHTHKHTPPCTHTHTHNHACLLITPHESPRSLPTLCPNLSDMPTDNPTGVTKKSTYSVSQGDTNHTHKHTPPCTKTTEDLKHTHTNIEQTHHSPEPPLSTEGGNRLPAALSSSLKAADLLQLIVELLPSAVVTGLYFYIRHLCGRALLLGHKPQRPTKWSSVLGGFRRWVGQSRGGVDWGGLN